ncbi:MAG: class A beta-lactamase-related serine hydrolase [Chloroflexi bacterium]|nr:MAG: class A beta-lactamase-related serine hydrolase [Chloroflexota bacterium]
MAVVRKVVSVLLVLVVVLGTGCRTQRDAYDALLAMMEETVDEDGPGVVLYTRGQETGEQVFARGVANQERETAVRTVNHFRLGGITKAFISTLVVQMVEEGDLSLDDTLGILVMPDIAAGIPNSDQITVRQMLNMTSGIADYRDNPEFWTAVLAKEKRGWQPEELITFAYDLEPTNAPGEAFAYSNTNYLLLQLVLNSVFEDTLQEETQDRIFDVLNLQDTYYEPIADTTGSHIPGYTDVDGDGKIESTAPYDDGRGLADLGIVASALDLGKIAPAFYNRALSGENGRSELLTTIDMGDGTAYGIGIMRRDSQWGEMWGYDTTSFGFSNQMWYLPEHDVTVIVFINHEQPELASTLVEKALTTLMPLEN